MLIFFSSFYSIRREDLLMQYNDISRMFNSHGKQVHWHQTFGRATQEVFLHLYSFRGEGEGGINSFPIIVFKKWCILLRPFKLFVSISDLCFRFRTGGDFSYINRMRLLSFSASLVLIVLQLIVMMLYFLILCLKNFNKNHWKRKIAPTCVEKHIKHRYQL